MIKRENNTPVNSVDQEPNQPNKEEPIEELFNCYKKLSTSYEILNDPLKLSELYNKIGNLINRCEITISEEEIKKYCLEHANRKLKRLISKGKYELDFSLLQSLKNELRTLKQDFQILFEQEKSFLEKIENKKIKSYSLIVRENYNQFMTSIYKLYEFIMEANDPELYLCFNTNKMNKPFTDLLSKASPFITLGCILFVISKSSFLDNIYYKITNPYDNNRLTLSEEEINNIKKKLDSELTEKIPEESLNDKNIDNYFLLNAVYENENLDDELKSYFYDLIEIIEDNPYLNKEKSYITLNQLEYEMKERPTDIDSKVKAQFIPWESKIEYFSDECSPELKEHISHHEDIHALFNNKNIPTFFREGITELLNREYLDDDPYSIHTGVLGYSNGYIYIPEITAVKLLCDLVGSDVVLETYTKSDMNIIYEALEKITGTKSDAKLLINCLDREIEKFGDEDQIPYTFDSKYVFEWLNKYADAKFKDKKNENIANKMNFNYNLSILSYIYSDKGFFNEYEQLVNTIGILEKAYFYDKLISLSSNQIVKYTDRIILFSERQNNKEKTLKKEK